MRLSSLQTVFASVGGMFAPRKEMRASARIDPASHLATLEGGELDGPPLAIAVRLANARSEVVVSREAVHE
ncbi:MAG TPA: hypothetical protein VFP44_05405 [Usitatibacter sp.]|nr:hypothetical protein [Usitatibacter sp.]